MKYLITGGAGFIGSHLAELLLEQNHEVIVVDDLSSGKIENLQLEKINFINKRIQDIAIETLRDVNGIFHLAAQVSVPLSIDNFFESSKNNLESSLKVIDFTRKLSVPLIYATSSAVYGNLPLGNDVIKEVDLQSPYAADKLTLELYAFIANRLYGLSSIGLRFFNVYGPRQDASNPYSGVISIFIDNILKHKKITVNGGFQTRDFVYVKDIVKILYKSMEIAKQKKFCEVFNVGTGRSITINYLVEILSKITQFKPEIDYKDLPVGDPERSEGTYDKLKKFYNINLNDFVKLEEGLKKTVDFFKEDDGGK